MELAFDFFKCLHDEATKEIKIALQSGLLAHHAEEQRMAYVLNAILQEHVIRYLGLRAFYLSANHRIKFKTEVSIGNSGYIDLILLDSDSEYAFELKRWQKAKEYNEIRTNDLKKLKSFMKEKGSLNAFEIIFTDNEHSDLNNPDQKYYENSFREDFGNQSRPV